jgi:hypothetical protein
MEKSIKYLTYNVVRDGKVVHSGKVPAMLADGGTNKDYDFEGIWLSRSSVPTTIQYLNETGNVFHSIPSDCHKYEWLSYADKVRTGAANPDVYMADRVMHTVFDQIDMAGTPFVPEQFPAILPESE